MHFAVGKSVDKFMPGHKSRLPIGNNRKDSELYLWAGGSKVRFEYFESKTGMSDQPQGKNAGFSRVRRDRD